VASAHTVYKGLKGSITAQRQKHAVVLINGLPGGGFHFSCATGFDKLVGNTERFKQCPQGRQMSMGSAASSRAIHEHKNGNVAWDSRRFRTDVHIVKE